MRKRNDSIRVFFRCFLFLDKDVTRTDRTHDYFQGDNNVHLEVLASLSRLLINPDFTASLKKAKTPEEVQGLFAAAEAAREAKEQAETVKHNGGSQCAKQQILETRLCGTVIREQETSKNV